MRTVPSRCLHRPSVVPALPANRGRKLTAERAARKEQGGAGRGSVAGARELRLGIA